MSSSYDGDCSIARTITLGKHCTNVEIDFIEVAIGMKDNVHVVETSDLRDRSERRRDEKQGKDHHILVGAEVMEKPKAR